MGEMGLDYHYDNSPREVQREVLKRQLAVAVGLNKPLTIHTREADDDILQILKENVPKDNRVSLTTSFLTSMVGNRVDALTLLDPYTLFYRYT